MKVTTDGCLFGAWVANQYQTEVTSRVLDIGTGTGLLTLMLAQKLNATFDSVEINQSAFEESSENFSKSPWTDRIRCHYLGIQDFKSTNLYDLIVCNPPFFSRNQTGKNQRKNQAVHDQSLPMDQLIAAVSRLLDSGGNLAIMYPYKEMNQFIVMAGEAGIHLGMQLNVYNQLGGEIFRVIAIFSRIKKQPILQDLNIRSGGEYSSDFLSYIEDYYL